MASTSRAFFLPFVRKEQIAQDAYSFYFDRTKELFDFFPGQYIRMTLPIEHADERGNARLFTIASCPLEKNHIMITTRIIQSSFKKTLVALSPGQEVSFFGPSGGFYLKDDEVSSHVFLAGGIGITPFHSMITYADQRRLTTPITLFVSFSTVDQIIFQKELDEIAKRNSNIKIIYTLTHPEESTVTWSGETGRISEELIKKYVQDVMGSLYYVAGPPSMVEAMEPLVKNMGVALEQIRIENFTGY